MEEFRCRAVDLCESLSGVTSQSIAGDLGISDGALREWVGKLGSGMRATDTTVSAVRSESQEAKVTGLEAGCRSR